LLVQVNGRVVRPVEHGLGVTYNNTPIKKKGLVYLGEWKDGRVHGVGYAFWLKSSVAWKNNRLAGSEIQDMRTVNGHNKHPGLPYCYSGKYENDFRSDDQAVVSLKDGSTRRGPWRNDEPVDKNNGEPDSWYNHDSVAAAAGPAAASLQQQHQEERKIAAAVTPSNKRKSSETTSRPTQPRSMRRGGPSFRGKIGPAAATPVCSRGVAIKQEPRDVTEIIEIQDDSDSEAPLESDLPKKEEELEESVVQQADTTTTTTSQAEEHARIQDIHDWLQQHVIGNGPNPDTMQIYL
jgi:hypothetical protein